MVVSNTWRISPSTRHDHRPDRRGHRLSLERTRAARRAEPQASALREERRARRRASGVLPSSKGAFGSVAECSVVPGSPGSIWTERAAPGARPVGSETRIAQMAHPIGDYECMKGQDRFSAQAAAEIRVLLVRVRTAERNEQKKLRARLRSIGFHISDWDTSGSGFARSDFDELVRRRLISTEPGEPPDASGCPAAAARPTAPVARSRQAAAAPRRATRTQLVAVLLPANRPRAKLLLLGRKRAHTLASRSGPLRTICARLGGRHLGPRFRPGDAGLDNSPTARLDIVRCRSRGSLRRSDRFAPEGVMVGLGASATPFTRCQ